MDKQKIEKIHANITAKTTIFPQSFAIAPIIVSEKIETQNAKEEIVPQSMEEIYQLSNQNRKRNKEKKKLKEDSLASNSNSNFTSPLGEFDPFVFIIYLILFIIYFKFIIYYNYFFIIVILFIYFIF